MPVGAPQGAGAPLCTMVRPLPDIRLEQSGHCALSARHRPRFEGGENGMRAIPGPKHANRGQYRFAVLNLTLPAGKIAKPIQLLSSRFSGALMTVACTLCAQPSASHNPSSPHAPWSATVLK